MVDVDPYYKAAADLVMMVHFGFVAFVVLSLPAIWIGHLLGKRFAYNPYFRLAHLGAMAIVVAEAVGGVICPLTDWEMALRLKAGQGEVYAGSFLQHWVHKILFFEAGLTVFQWAYGLFFGLILVTVYWVRPDFERLRRWRWRERGKGVGPPKSAK